MKFMRAATVFICVLALGFVADISSAEAARSHRQVRHHHVHHKTKKAKRSKVKASPLREAQAQLVALGYYAGKVDGKAGPMTREAIKAFQKDNALPVTGKLTAETKAQLLQASAEAQGKALKPVLDVKNLFAQANLPLIASADPETPVTITSRYTAFDVREEWMGSSRSYTVTANGTPVFTADNQPGRLSISPTYEVGAEDAVVLTVYAGGSACFYQNFVMVIRQDGSVQRPYEIRNCEKEHVEQVAQGSLFVGFPNGHDRRNVGDIWRYENGTLEQLN